jgi:hypothetical protein
MLGVVGRALAANLATVMYADLQIAGGSVVAQWFLARGVSGLIRRGTLRQQCRSASRRTRRLLRACSTLSEAGGQAGGIDMTKYPGFSADASVYKTTNVYRGVACTNKVALVSPQSSCTDSCWESYALCDGLCTVGAILSFGAGTGPCFYGCWVRQVQCLANCEGTTGGGGGSSMCCPVGKNCRCGGKCVKQADGSIHCVDGLCLTPNQECP